MIKQWNLNKTEVILKLFTAGFCRNSECLTIEGGTLRPVPFPAGFALIIHPQHGHLLFDTGYAQRFFTETEHFPQRFYRIVTPVTLGKQESAVQQLRKLGIEPSMIKHVILSHFHADHIAGLKDFSSANIIYKREAYDAVKGLGTLAAVKAAFLPKLLPDDLAERSQYIEQLNEIVMPDHFPFRSGFDLFGDGSLIAVDLPGHAAGQIGLFLKTSKQQVFLCADAVWSSKAIRENRLPHPLTRLILNNYEAFVSTFGKLRSLHQQYPQITIIPSHCQASIDGWKE